MDEETSQSGHRSASPGRSWFARAAALIGVLALATALSTQILSVTSTQSAAAAPLDPDVVLPARVGASLQRTLAAVDRGAAAVDDRRSLAARWSLDAATRDFPRAHRAATRQLQAPPAGEEGEESTAGPDSVLAVLAVEQDSVARLSGLYDGLTWPKVMSSLTRALNAAQTQRAHMLDAVIALPEEDRAAYADGLADTVPLYTDEVAGLTEALADDKLTAAGRSALSAALVRSKQAEAKVTAAFGGED